MQDEDPGKLAKREETLRKLKPCKRAFIKVDGGIIEVVGGVKAFDGGMQRPSWRRRMRSCYSAGGWGGCWGRASPRRRPSLPRSPATPASLPLNRSRAFHARCLSTPAPPLPPQCPPLCAPRLPPCHSTSACRSVVFSATLYSERGVCGV